MAGITLAQAEAKLAEFLAAETKVSQSQAYKISDREMQKAKLDEIAGRIDYWDRKVKELTNSASGIGRSRTVSPRW